MPGVHDAFDVPGLSLCPHRGEARPYSEVPPPPDLAEHVDRFWMRTSLPAPEPELVRVVPDGCLDLLLDLDLGTATVVGTMTRPLLVPEGPARILSVRFKPGKARPFLGLPLRELTNWTPRASELALPEDGLVESVLRPCRRGGGLHALVGWLRARLPRGNSRDGMVSRAVAQLTAVGAPSIAGLASRLGVTRQHLARVFQNEVGLTPKELVRVARVQRAIWALGRGDVDFGELAVHLGYFDQAHFIHDVRMLTGLTPLALLESPPIGIPHLFAVRSLDVPFFQSRSPRNR